jgi:hypothetical protein
LSHTGRGSGLSLRLGFRVNSVEVAQASRGAAGLPSLSSESTSDSSQRKFRSESESNPGNQPESMHSGSGPSQRPSWAGRLSGPDSDRDRHGGSASIKFLKFHIKLPGPTSVKKLVPNTDDHDSDHESDAASV